MCYHEWGDNWPHWEELYAAENYIIKFVKRYSFCYLSSKEKYGTLRYERIIAPGGFSFGSYIKLPFFKKSFRCADGSELKIPIFLWVWNRSFIYRLWTGWGKFMLKIAIKKACKKFPNCKSEILDDLEYIQ